MNENKENNSKPNEVPTRVIHFLFYILAEGSQAPHILK
jgi:hypothetical protein